MAIGNMSAVELAKQRAEQSGGNGGNATFFSLQEGEKKYLRFLTGMVDYHVVSHSCGLNLFDYKKGTWDELLAMGQQPLCPNCGQPLSDSDIQYERNEHAIADLHNYFPTGDGSGNRTTLVCLASPVNASRGWIPVNDAGEPMYQCPACSAQCNRNKQGQPKKPSMKLYGIAVEREVVMGTEMVNGMMVPVVKSVQDVMVEDDAGNPHPKVVVVQMSWGNFWQKLSTFDPSYEQSICSYDWAVQRIGSGLNTDYDLQRIDNMPSIVDARQYADWMPDVPAIVKAQGSPEYYAKKGYQVSGYVPQGTLPNAAGTAQAALQNAAMGVAQQPVVQYQQQPIPQAQPMQGMGVPQPMPQQAQGGSNDWSVVQNQFS